MARRRDRVLIIDDDDGVRSAVAGFLELHDYDVSAAAGAGEAEAAALARAPDLALLDLRLPDGDGLDVLSRLRAAQPGLVVVILTGHASVDAAVSAVKRGAEHFLTKPVDLEALLLVLQRALEGRRNQQRQVAARSRGAAPRVLLGDSPALRRVAREAEQICDTELPVLIRGETGTGKGLLARWLHDSGPRRQGPFVDLNCAGISHELLDAELFGHEAGAFTGALKAKPGLLEVGHGGTVFLDEIGDMAPAIQARVLKVLEEKRFRRLGDVHDRAVDIRLVAATHQDLERQIQAGRFRQDLYFRICAVELHLPPLRERIEDLELLSRSLLAHFARETGRPTPVLGGAALDLLRGYAWPGNVRELRNVLEAAALRCGGPVIEPEDLRLRGAAAGPAPLWPAEPAFATPDDAPFPTLAEVESAHIRRALDHAGGHVARAALLLGVSTSSLYERLRRSGLAAPRERRGHRPGAPGVNR